MPRFDAHPSLALGTLFLACSLAPLCGQGRGRPYRVVDIHPKTVVDTDPVERRFAALGDYVYYAGTSQVAGVELFRARISTAKVELVKDIEPGDRGSEPFGFTTVGQRLYFFAATAARGYELWVTDGTAAGTTLVVDLYLGVASSMIPDPRAPAALGLFKGDLMFGAEDAGGAYGLWRSDGTASGTVRLKSLGIFKQRTPIRGFVSAGSFACFLLRDDSIDGFRVWRTDGTGPGTRSILGFPRALDAVAEDFKMTVAGDTVFVTSAGNLWRINATASTADRLLQGTGLLHTGFGSLPDPKNPQKSVFFFSAGTLLWKSDGTMLGTGLFFPQRGVGVLNSNRQSVAIVNGRMFFLGFDLRHGEELWSSDGTTGGTGLVVDVRPGPLGSTGRQGFGRVRRVITSGQLVYFAADDGKTGVELHVTDGTAAGTRLVGDVGPGSASSNPRRLLSLGGGKVAFLAEDGAVGAVGPGLFVYRPGTPIRKAATNLAPIPSRTRESRVLGLQSHDDQVFFAADDGSTGSELWCSDGVSVSTRRVSDLWPGTASGLRHHDWANGPVYGALQGISLGKDLFFTAYRGDRNLALFKTDGTTAGTVHVQDLDMVGGVGWQLRGLGVGTTLFSHAASKTQGEGLFSFGSGGGLTRLANVLPGVYHRLGRKLIFTDSTPPTLRGVWVSDGTVAGTVPLVRYSRLVFDPFCVVNLGSKGFFSTMNQGGELYETDGTQAGTRRIRGAAIRSMAVAGDRLFTLEEDGKAVKLTVGDGTSTGTVVLHGALPVSARGLVASGSRVFFHGFVEADNQLWVSDGSIAGTRVIHNFDAHGVVLPRIEALRSVGSRRVFFRVERSKGVGIELWESDGTSLGTHPIADIQLGPGDGVGVDLAHARGKLFFRGDDGRSGSLDGDLWVTDIGGVTYPLGQGCAASGFPPRLSGTDPVIGGKMDLQVDGTPRTAGLLILGPAIEPALEFGFGCRLFVNLGVGFGTGFVTSATGRWRLAGLPIPNLPGTRGLRIVAQIALGSTAQLPLRTDLSNLLVMVMGN